MPLVHLISAACCAVEASAVQGVDFAGPEQAPDFIVVAGTVTAYVAEQVAQARANWPQAPVVAFGVCSISGGPYQDAPSVLPGVTADILVPGCPPSPADLARALGGTQ